MRISGFKTGSGPGLSRIQLDPAKLGPHPIQVQKTWSWIRSGSTAGRPGQGRRGGAAAQLGSGSSYLYSVEPCTLYSAVLRCVLFSAAV